MTEKFCLPAEIIEKCWDVGMLGKSMDFDLTPPASTKLSSKLK
jgi:hypothetical protein